MTSVLIVDDEIWICKVVSAYLEDERSIAHTAEDGQQAVALVGTVKAHTNRIFSKLQARNRTEAVARACDVGWVER